MGEFYKDENGNWRCKVIHRMGRRCLNWDYCCDAVYLITLVLADRSKPILGRLVVERADGRAIAGAAQLGAASGGDWGELRPEEVRGRIELSELGAAIERHWRRIGEFTPEIKPLCCQVMPEHFHGVLWVRRRLKKPLGDAIRGFKGGCTKLYRAWLEGTLGVAAEAQRGGEATKGTGETAGRGPVALAGQPAKLFADGYVDDILFDKRAFEKGSAYVLDNARRLAIKRFFPDLFKVARDLEIKGVGHFMAIGNHFLLDKPHLYQVQCSRSDFAYRKDERGGLLKDEPPLLSTPEFERKLAEMKAAAKHGAVIVSPCISQGERELARRAFDAGFSVVTLQNKGFSPLYKPGGRLFDQCADGRLLMLAPIAWPYVPGEKKMTRMDACALNRIAQLICGEDAAEINYKGLVPEQIDRLVREAVDG